MAIMLGTGQIQPYSHKNRINRFVIGCPGLFIGAELDPPFTEFLAAHGLGIAEHVQATGIHFVDGRLSLGFAFGLVT